MEKILESRQATDGTGEEFLCKFEGELEAPGGRPLSATPPTD